MDRVETSFSVKIELVVTPAQCVKIPTLHLGSCRDELTSLAFGLTD